MGKQWKQCQTLFFGAPKSLQMVIAAMKLKDAYSLESYDQPQTTLLPKTDFLRIGANLEQGFLRSPQTLLNRGQRVPLFRTQEFTYKFTYKFHKANKCHLEILEQSFIESTHRV